MAIVRRAPAGLCQSGTAQPIFHDPLAGSEVAHPDQLRANSDAIQHPRRRPDRRGRKKPVTSLWRKQALEQVSIDLQDLARERGH